VGERAVQQVLVGRVHYRCDSAVVVTNSVLMPCRLPLWGFPVEHPPMLRRWVLGWATSPTCTKEGNRPPSYDCPRASRSRREPHSGESPSALR
jgi:hypothetical protein